MSKGAVKYAFATVQAILYSGTLAVGYKVLIDPQFDLMVKGPPILAYWATVACPLGIGWASLNRKIEKALFGKSRGEVELPYLLHKKYIIPQVVLNHIAFQFIFIPSLYLFLRLFDQRSQKMDLQGLVGEAHSFLRDRWFALAMFRFKVTCWEIGSNLALDAVSALKQEKYLRLQRGNQFFSLFVWQIYILYQVLGAQKKTDSRASKETIN
jgi:hypothetical protein